MTTRSKTNHLYNLRGKARPRRNGLPEITRQVLRTLEAPGTTAFPYTFTPAETAKTIGISTRRVYDILHVLVGTGVVKHSGTKHNKWQYQGYAQARVFLKRIQELLPSNSHTEICTILQEQGAGHLSKITLFILIVLSAERKELPLVELHEKFEASSGFDSFGMASILSRRMYDVLSVLVGCELLSKKGRKGNTKLSLVDGNVKKITNKKAKGENKVVGKSTMMEKPKTGKDKIVKDGMVKNGKVTETVHLDMMAEVACLLPEETHEFVDVFASHVKTETPVKEDVHAIPKVIRPWPQLLTPTLGMLEDWVSNTPQSLHSVSLQSGSPWMDGIFVSPMKTLEPISPASSTFWLMMTKN